MSKFKIYKHEGCGHYIGSCVAVVAKNESDARFFIRQALDEGRLHGEEINEIEEINIADGVVIINDNWDY